jgi:hypothetical protein
MPKPPPVYDLDLVLHPEHDTSYVHFENGVANPFVPNPGAVPRVNAWWMAEAALLSYWKPADAIPIFQNAGLQAEFVEANATDTQCYVAWSADHVIAAFRGTEPDEWPDVLTDVKIAQVPWIKTGQVHSGFAEALDDIWLKLSAKLDSLSGRAIWFCGHSLGAALATLAADRYDATRGVCTFGSPRVGDPAFAAAFTARFVNRSLRYVNDHDVVTHVPPPFTFPWLYRHVDPRRFIDPSGQISNGAPTLPHFFEDLIGPPKALLDIINAQIAAPGHAPTFVLDHMPKAYAIWTWNDYEAHG